MINQLGCEESENTMGSRVCMLLIGAVYIYYQVLAGIVIDDGELMVESNVTLEVETILSALNVTNINVTRSTLTVLHSKLVSECLIVGKETNCNCSDKYTWSNDVCYTESCCSESPCTQNVSDITPLCVAKVPVYIYGTIRMQRFLRNSKDIKKELETAFKELNGFESLNVTGQRPGDNIVEFRAAVSVKFETSKLQSIVSQLETSLGAVIWVDIEGMVTIEAPEITNYMSSPNLKCTFEEKTDSAGWNMSRNHERFDLNNGTVVKLNDNCATEEYKSCTELTLHEVTSIWEGTYECGFTNGSVRYIAKTQLRVLLLPDEIILNIDPLALDCSNKEDSESVDVNVTATIQNSTESYEVWWSYRDEGKHNLVNRSDGENLVYSFTANISCKISKISQYVTVTFENMADQNKTERVDIPVIYKGKAFCKKDEFWPNTPSGDTVINRTCEDGRTGYKSRTCDGTIWQDVFFYCIDQKLNGVLYKADKFRDGQRNPLVAMDIFAELKNYSTSNSNDSSSVMADLMVSINVLNAMANASEIESLEERVLPDFVDAASNILNKPWVGVNNSIIQNMSSSYLLSVENLVKTVKVNTSNSPTINSTNLDLKFCSVSGCSVFDINVHLSQTTGMMRTVAVKNLTDKLNNNFPKKNITGLLLSVTRENNSDSALEIRMSFPKETGEEEAGPSCVFWNIAEDGWSDRGCSANFHSDGNRILCVCNHLTGFSILMSKSDTSDEVLNMITYVGLGVSICSLLIFLIIESLVWSAVVKTNLSFFRHTAMVNIAIFLLLGNCSFLASSNPKILSDTWCLVLTICKQLFFLAMFCWMLCLSGILVHQLIFVFSPVRKRVFIVFSSIVGYGFPILMVGSSYVYYKYTDQSYYNRKTCWLIYKRPLVGSLHAFLLPVGTITLINLFSMVVVILTMMKSSVPDDSKKNDKQTAKSILKVVLFLTPVFGVTWAIGLIVFILNQNDPIYKVAEYSFTILNSLQGLFILLIGCLTEEKVREELIKLITAKSKGQSGSMKKSMNSTTYTKDN